MGWKEGELAGNGGKCGRIAGLLPSASPFFEIFI